jgi:class 3 adenylate cyclase
MKEVAISQLSDQLVAQFIEIAAQVICQHKGILDKLLGDGVMALFSSHSKS